MNDPMDKKSFELHPQPDVLVGLMEEFTSVYRDSAGVSVAEREARCEKVQWKAKVRPIRENDLFAGRMVQAPIGFAGQTDGASMGYYLNEEAMESLIKNPLRLPISIILLLQIMVKEHWLVQVPDS